MTTVVIAVVGLVSGPALAAAGKGDAGWKRVGGSGLYIVADDGRNQFWYERDQSDAVLLVNDRTGRHAQLNGPAGSSVSRIGGGWVSFWAFTPAGGAVLTLIAPERRQRATLPIPAAELAQICPPIPHAPHHYCKFGPLAVGRHWVAFPDRTGVFYENIQTRRTVTGGGDVGFGRPTTPFRRIDLNTRALLRPVCRPLRNPRTTDLTGSAALTSLQFHGPFTLTSRSPDAAVFHLERCGTRQQRAIHLPARADPPPAINDQAVAWITRPGWLAELQLPTLQKIALRLPRQIAAPSDVGALQLLVGRHRVYVEMNDLTWSHPLR